MAAETITITIKADDDASATLKKLRDEIDNVGKAGKGAGKGVGGAPGKKGGGLGSALGGLMMSAGPYGAAAAAIGGALIGIGKASIGAAAEMEKLTSQMAAALPATESADVRMAQLVKTSKEMVGLDLANMVKFDTQLRSVGLNSKQIDTTIQAVTKSMAAQGKSTADTTRVLDQLQQAFASGSIKAEDMKTVFREMPGFQNAVKTAFGENVTSIDKFRDAAAAAGLTAEQALMSALTELDKASEGASLDTYAAQTEMLGENFSQLGAKIGGAVLPAITWLVKGLNSLLDGLPAAWEWVKNFFVKTLPDLFGRLKDWVESIVLIVADIARRIKNVYLAVINGVISVVDKITGVFGVSIKDMIAKIPIIGQLLSKEQQEAEKAFIEARRRGIERRANEREEAKERAAEAEKEAAAAIAREEAKQKEIERIAEEFRVAARDKRIEYLNTLKGIEKTDFEARRKLVDDYYDALEQSITNSLLTEEQKKEELQLAEKNRAAARAVIKTDETNHAISELDRQIEETKNANEALAANEETTREEMKTAVNAYYDLEEERARLKIKDQTELDTELTKIRGDRDEKIRKVDSDYDKRDEQRKREELKRQQELDKQLAASLEARADKAKRDLDKVVSETTSSLEDRKTANDTYYAHLTAQMLQREKDTGKHQGILEDMTKQRLASEKTLTENYYTALVNKQELSLRAMAVSEDASIEERKVQTEALFALKEQKLRAEEKDTKVLNDKLTLLAHERNSALAALTDEEIARDEKKTREKIQNIDDEIAKQELAIQVLNANEQASTDERIAETERLHNLKVQKLFEEEKDAEVRKDKLILLEQETADAIEAIEDEKTDKAAQKQRERIADAEDALSDILSAEESTAEQINAAAQLVYDEKKAYVDDYVKDEEEAAELIEGFQKDLDAVRTSSMEQFWERHGQLVQQGLDLALQAAQTEIKLMKGVRDAERNIQQDRARARVEFDAEWQSIVQGYTAEIELARAQAIPIIKEAFDRGDKEEANRLQAELDKLIGMTSTGQVLLDEHGNQMGLIAERTKELQAITDDINEAELDFFAEIRDIQNEAKQARAKAWWEVGGQLVGQALGAGVSALSGGAIPTDMAMKVGGDLGKFVGTELGDIHAGRIEDSHLRRELEIYQRQQQLKSENRAKGIRSSSDLSRALKGSDFDPVVIAQKEADAQAAIVKRLKELHQEKIDDVKWTMEQEKRAFDRLRDDTNATLADITARYDVYYESQKTLATLQAKDQEDLNRELRRLWWQRVDTLDAVKDAMAKDDKKDDEPAERTPRERGTPTRDTGRRAGDSGSREADASRRQDLRWAVEDAKYDLDQAVANEKSALETLQGLHDTYWARRLELAKLSAKSDKERARADITVERQRLTSLERLERDYYAGVERRRAADLRDAQEKAAEKQETLSDERKTAIATLKWQIETAAYEFAKQRNDEKATLAELESAHAALYQKKMELSVAEGAATDDAIERQRKLIRLERERADSLAALQKSIADREARKKAAEEKAAAPAPTATEPEGPDPVVVQRKKDIADLKWEIETAAYLLGQLRKKESATLEELQAQHTALYDFKKRLSVLEGAGTDDAIARQRKLIRIERERTEALISLEEDWRRTQETLRKEKEAKAAETLRTQQDANAKEAEKREKQRKEDIATLKWQVETAAYLLDQLHKKESVTLEELQEQHRKLWQLKQELSVAEGAGTDDAIARQRKLIRIERERVAALAALDAAWNKAKAARAAEETRLAEETAEKTKETRRKTLQWEIENTAYLLAQRKLQEGITLEELKGGARALWDYKKQLIELEIDNVTDKERALTRLERQRTEALTTLETDYLHAQERAREKERAKKARGAADEKAELLDDLKWEVETTTYYLNRMKRETWRTYQEIAAQQTVLFDLRVKQAELTAKDEEDKTRAITRLEREHVEALEALKTAHAERQKRAREADLAEREAAEREARETAEREASQAADTQQQQQKQVADTARETTDTVIDTTREQVESQTDASTKMMQSMAASARESGSAIQSVAQTMRALGASLKEQTAATVDAMNDIADETIAAIYELLDVTEETAGQRVTTETGADAEIRDSKASTTADIQTGFDGLYTHLTETGETWKTGFETQLNAIVTATGSQTATAKTLFDSFYAGITARHNSFGVHFITSVNFATAFIESVLAEWQTDYTAFYDARQTELDDYTAAFASSLGTQFLLTEAVTTAMETEYVHLYESLRSHAQSYAEFQGALVDDLSDSLSDIQRQLTYAEDRAHALGEIHRDRNRIRNVRERELFHSADMDAIASAGGRSTAERIKRENASDFTHFFSKDFLESWRNVNGAPPGAVPEQPFNIVLNVQWDDGTTLKLHEETVRLKDEGRIQE